MRTYWVEEDTPGLPLGVSVSIELVGNVQYVTIHSRLHLTKEKRLPYCYGTSYSVRGILLDSDFLKYLEGYR